MKRDIAEKLVRELLTCSSKLDQSIAMVQSTLPAEVFFSYRRLVGQIMGDIYIEILREIFREHPELEPESMR